MALASLATAADLTARKIDVTDTVGVAAQLAAASSAVRAAAGCAITLQTSTVTLSTEASRRIELPARPVRAVASVTLDGVIFTEWVLRGSCLWRNSPTSYESKWQAFGDIPSELVVTFTHGFTEVPADVVDMVCSLAGAGLASIGEGFQAHTGVNSESIDDYRVGYTTGADAVVSVMDLPDRTKAALRKRFGSGGAMVVGSIL